MGIDNSTKISVEIDIDDNPKYLSKLRKRHKEDNEENNRKGLKLYTDKHKIRTDEYLFEKGAIIYNGEMESDEGTSYVHLEIPLSDTVLIDILQHSIKRLNKLKTALETLR